MVLDPNEYTARELRGSDSELDGLSADELEAVLEAEREGKNRDTAIEQIERALADAREAEGGEAEAEEEADGEDDPLEDLYEDEEDDYEGTRGAGQGRSSASSPIERL